MDLGFSCCCRWHISGSPSGVAPGCCQVSRPPLCCLAVSSLAYFLASWASAVWRTRAVPSTSALMSTMPIPHSTLFSWCSSHFVSLSTSNSFIPSHTSSSRATCASIILAIISMVWFCRVTLHAGCLTFRFIRLLLSPGAPTGSQFTFLNHLPFSILFHCSLAAMTDMLVVFPDISPATPLASPASVMSISRSTGGFSIIAPIKLWVFSVTMVAGFHDV